MNAQETRILPLARSMSREYAIVSMSSTIWYWLDDMIESRYPNGGYSSFIEGVKADTPEDLKRKLEDWVQSHFEEQMEALYALANDNIRIFPKSAKPSPGNPYKPDYSGRMPSVYQLFKFMPHATYLTTVWERRNYHLGGDLL